VSVALVPGEVSVSKRSMVVAAAVLAVLVAAGVVVGVYKLTAR